MIIYLSQHGKCNDGDSSDGRALSELGLRETRAVAERLGEIKLSVVKIFHSGKVRAGQTAEIFASFVSAPVEVSPVPMSPKDDVTGFSRCLADGALYVGHLPFMERLASFLVCGKADETVIKFQNSGVICLEEKEDGRFAVIWSIFPSLES